MHFSVEIVDRLWTRASEMRQGALAHLPGTQQGDDRRMLQARPDLCDKSMTLNKSHSAHFRSLATKMQDLLNLFNRSGNKELQGISQSLSMGQALMAGVRG